MASNYQRLEKRPIRPYTTEFNWNKINKGKHYIITYISGSVCVWWGWVEEGGGGHMVWQNSFIDRKGYEHIHWTSQSTNHIIDFITVLGGRLELSCQIHPSHIAVRLCVVVCWHSHKNCAELASEESRVPHSKWVYSRLTPVSHVYTNLDFLSHKRCYV